MHSNAIWCHIFRSRMILLVLYTRITVIMLSDVVCGLVCERVKVALSSSFWRARDVALCRRTSAFQRNSWRLWHYDIMTAPVKHRIVSYSFMISDFLSKSSVQAAGKFSFFQKQDVTGAVAGPALHLLVEAARADATATCSSPPTWPVLLSSPFPTWPGVAPSDAKRCHGHSVRKTQCNVVHSIINHRPHYHK